MAGRQRQLTGLKRAALVAAALFAFVPGSRNACAAPAPSASPAPPHPAPAPSLTPALIPPTPAAQPAPTAKPKPQPQKPEEWTEAHRLFEQLSADQQRKFLENLDQWKTMSPEEQELFRDRELFRREKIALEIQQAINKSGLKLDDDQREVYALRYTQERRKIEETLRREMDQKRQVMVGEMLDRLKVEFAASVAPAPKH